MKPLGVLLIVLLAPLPSGAAMPPCRQANAGELWPDRANAEPSIASLAGRCGVLQVCSKGPWRYRWERVTVRFGQLMKDGRVPEECRELSAADAATRKETGTPRDEEPIAPRD